MKPPSRLSFDFNDGAGRRRFVAAGQKRVARGRGNACRLDHSVLGVKVGGEVTATGAAVSLEAWKDCTLDVNGIAVTLRKGESKISPARHK